MIVRANFYAGFDTVIRVVMNRGNILHYQRNVLEIHSDWLIIWDYRLITPKLKTLPAVNSGSFSQFYGSVFQNSPRNERKSLGNSDLDEHEN